MSHLKFLQLSYNDLSGHIPEELGDVVSLEQIDLAHNRFNGPVPESIGALSNLQSLILDENKLSGRLPENIISLPKLQLLQLKNNDFEIPYLYVIAARKPNLLKFDFKNQDLLYENQDFNRGTDQENKSTTDTQLED